MNVVKDTTSTEVRRTVRVEFTQAQVAKILLRHWQTISRRIPLGMTVVSTGLSAPDDDVIPSPICLDVTFHSYGEPTDVPQPVPEVPQYWTCVISRKGLGDEIRYVFGAGLTAVDRRLREVYPLLTWRHTAISQTLPTGVRESEILEALS